MSGSFDTSCTVAHSPRTPCSRHSCKNPHGPAVVFTAAAWTSFVTEVKTIAL
ncbi:DUF397 domain-containing protein [Streptomyces sp. NPDC001530]|uniref:DUF397 domain-containing protein n=1 Tax=Streptomyces sp. NPDC001530 TaxID=3364582 RepID=UPI00368617A8